MSSLLPCHEDVAASNDGLGRYNCLNNVLTEVAKLVIHGAILHSERKKATVCTTIIQRNLRAMDRHRDGKCRDRDDVDQRLDEPHDTIVGTRIDKRGSMFGVGDRDGDGGQRVSNEAADPR
jgi:hypothetical protein